MKVLLTSVVVFFALAASASAEIGWFAKWQGSGEIIVYVSGPGLDQMDSRQREAFLAAMADWAASPNVEFRLGRGKVKVYVDDECGGACAIPKFSNGKLRSVELHFAPQYLGFVDIQGYFCHELGHALGLGEGYPVEVTGDVGSCMADPSALHPSAMDFEVLSDMYPL